MVIDMKIADAKAYREVYEQWMAKQVEIVAAEVLLQALEKESTAIKQRLDDYKLQRSHE